MGQLFKLPYLLSAPQPTPPPNFSSNRPRLARVASRHLLPFFGLQYKGRPPHRAVSHLHSRSPVSTPARSPFRSQRTGSPVRFTHGVSSGCAPRGRRGGGGRRRRAGGCCSARRKGRPRRAQETPQRAPRSVTRHDPHSLVYMRSLVPSRLHR